MRKLDALHALARLSVSDTTDPVDALCKAIRIVEAVTGSKDVRVIGGDATSFWAYPPRENEDFFGLSVEGMMLGSQETRKLGQAAVHTTGRDGLPKNIAPADGKHTGTSVGMALWIGDSFGGNVVARGRWTPQSAQRAGRFLEAAAPSLAIMLERVQDAQRRTRLQQQMNGLADVAGVFTRAENMEDVLGDVVNAINSATGFLASIDVLDSNGRIAMRSAAASRFTDTPLYDLWLRMTRAPDLTRRMILQNPEPIILPNLHYDPRVSKAAQEFYRRTGMVSGATLPLLFQNEVVGLLRVGSLRPTSFEPPTLDLLRGLALQTAVVVKGIRLWGQLQRSRKETERFAARLQARNAELVNEVAERRRAEEALQSSEEKYRDLVENLNEVIFSLDHESLITYVSPAVEQVAGYSPAELTGRPFAEFIHPDDSPWPGRCPQWTVEDCNAPAEFRIVTKSGGLRWVRTSGRPVLEGNKAVGLRAVLMDITEHKQAEAQIEYLAYHDALTGLPNRTLLKDRLTTALAQRRRDKKPLALMFLDLDRFKLVNDMVGHALGDQVLQDVAERLISIVREGDTVARLGGDEFTLLLPAVAGADEACQVAERILERFRQPWALGGQQFHITASIGIAVYPRDGRDAESLLRSADTAMYRAKDKGRDNLQLFTPAMSVDIRDRVILESDLRQALDRGEIVVYYQPQVNTESGQIVGMEALVRWHHPRRGVVHPDDFIPLAEETGLIVPLGEWVLHTACAQNKAYQDAGLSPIRVAVNLSSRQFQDPGLVTVVSRVLNETRLNPDHLDVEITEGTAMRDIEFTIKMLRELRVMGVHASVDDFGTGYSSLAYMKRLPIDSVKIDRSFVIDAPVNRDDAAIVAAIVALARTLNLRVVAEGVETNEQLAVIREQLCHEAQGYLFGEAMPGDAMERLLRDSQARPMPAAQTRAGEAA